MPFAADDFKSIALRAAQIEAESCQNCEGLGWVFDDERGIWKVCGECDNPSDLDEPDYAP